MYNIIFEKSAQKKLYKLPANVREKIIPKIQALAETPRPHGAKKLLAGPVTE